MIEKRQSRAHASLPCTTSTIFSPSSPRAKCSPKPNQIPTATVGKPYNRTSRSSTRTRTESSDPSTHIRDSARLGSAFSLQFWRWSSFILVSRGPRSVPSSQILGSASASPTSTTPCTAPSAFTQNGDLDERRFDYVFSMYSTPPHTHLTFAEGVRMLRGNRNVCDLFGWFAAACDWGATYLLLWPSDGRVTKQDVHDIMDGSLFPKLAQKIRNANKA